MRYSFIFILLIILIVSIVLVSIGCQSSIQPIVIENQAPQIEELIYETKVEALSQNTVACFAIDPEADNLTYVWKASNGTVDGLGSKAVWVAPEVGGNCTLEVTVIDSQGNSTSKSLFIMVTENIDPPKPPVIQKIITESVEGPITIVPTDTPAAIQPLVRGRIWQSYSIECIALDTDGDKLSYEWSITGGKITGSGSKIIWTAPGVAGTYSISVTVTCKNGTTDPSTVQITVKCCGGY
jgi:hypothetical protein